LLEASLPPLVVGTARLGGPVFGWTADRAQLFRYLDALVDLGLYAFDLAASYQIGGTERLFGTWVATRAPTDLFLMTKGGHPLPLIAPHRLGRRALTSDLDASLSRLRADHVDLYWLHRDDEHTPLSEIAQTLTDFRKSGKIRAYGLSNWRAGRVDALAEVARQLGLDPPSAVSPHYSLFEWTRPPWPGCVSISGDRASLESYRKTGLPIFPWSPLASGFLREARASGGVYDSPKNHERKRRLDALARTRGVEPTALLLAYAKQSLPRAFPVVASSNVGRMEQNLRALEIRLDQEEVEFLEGDDPHASKLDGNR
jgi:aryl-alcohol dehydrogenase-like predicted oxidoreductase